MRVYTDYERLFFEPEGEDFETWELNIIDIIESFTGWDRKEVQKDEQCRYGGSINGAVSE